MRKLMHSKVKHSKAAATWRAIARPRGAIPRPRSGAEAWRTPCRKGSSQEELPHVGGEGQQPRIPDCDGAGTAGRSYPASEVRGGGREERQSLVLKLPHPSKISLLCIHADTWGCGRPGIIPACVLQEGQCLVSSDILSPLGNIYSLALYCRTNDGSELFEGQAWAAGASSTLAADSETD